MTLRVRRVGTQGLTPYASALRALEAEVSYPLDTDRFVIDHGPLYHPFFSALGHPEFFVLLDGARVAGSLAGVLREARCGGRRIEAAYLADYKLARAYRGRGAAVRLGWAALRAPFERRRFRRWRLAWFAAMRGAGGDVTRSIAGAHPGRLMRPAAELLIYFEPPARVAALAGRSAPPPAGGRCWDLSPRSSLVREDQEASDTRGRKDFRLLSSGRAWPLAHLPVSPAHPRWGRILAGCAARLDVRGLDQVACFALDDRLSAQRGWLADGGLKPGATCRIYALALPPVCRPDWVHLSTAEI